MDDSDLIDKSLDHIQVIQNINLLTERLNQILVHKQTDFLDIDSQISSLVYQMNYFSMLVNFFYPLKRTCEMLKTNPEFTNEKIAENQTMIIDRINRKSFLALTLFDFETLLHVIAEKYHIPLNDHIIKNYMKVIRYFKVKDDEYENLLKIVHYTRNSLHSDTRIKKEWCIKYKGKEFSMKIGQKRVKHVSWDYFIYFIGNVIEIFEKIYKSSKFNDRMTGKNSSE